MPACLASAVLGLWCFPEFWFIAQAGHAKVSFEEKREIDGWTFEEIPISQAAERALVADQIVNGEFRSEVNTPIRVFSAKRFSDNPNEIGLFVHTPDRCWVEGGWKLAPAGPDFIEINLHNSQIKLERRIFQYGNNKEIVYFGGLIDGHVLPYRLDHNLSMAARTALKENLHSDALNSSASKFHFWQRLWSSFTIRTKLSGPKHFFRISTPVDDPEQMEATDRRLTAFLQNWLIPTNSKLQP